MWSLKWSAAFALVVESTRNDLLGQLVGTVFYQVGHGMARRLAAAQFAERKVNTNACEDEHMQQFQGYWTGAEENWMAGLSQSEKQVLGQLTTPHERDAFRIIRSFQRKADYEGRTDFPIARDNLASRLGITGKGAAWVRDRLVQVKAIERTEAYKPNRAAARYRWVPEFIAEPVPYNV